MGLISRVSSRTYRFKYIPVQNPKSKKMVQRITYRRRLAWNTTSNQRRIAKTPGAKLVFLYTGKRGTVTKCGDTGKALQGIKANRPADLQAGRSTRRSRTVSRAYLIEEQKIVAKVLKAQKEAAAKATKEAEAKSSKKSKKGKGKK